jgi:hypothetical protein
MADEVLTGGAKRSVGSRASVMHGTAHHTKGGLTKKQLKYNKYGKIVSARKSALAKSKGTLKKWEKKTGHRWTIKNGKPTKVSHGKKGKKGGADPEDEAAEEVAAVTA